ncbi:hypothetical protein ACT80S_00085 [Ramlibacter sp. MAHUQ-53]|uniref:hypothetical protein n=1 Tax=unclassified Ramlibacter TaxID=2617605 RepID=UPI003639B036
MTQHCYVDWAVLLEYLRLFLAWPFLSMVTVIVFLLVFRGSLHLLIGRIKSIEGWGGRLDTTPAERQAQRGSLPTPNEPHGPGDEPTSVAAIASTTVLSTSDLPPQADAGPSHQGGRVDWLAHYSSDPTRAKAEILRWWTLAKYESVFNLIFGTQVRLIHALSQVPATGDTKENIHVFYDEHRGVARSMGVNPAPEADFFSFLTRDNFIRFEGGRVYITEWGQAFATHIATRYGPMALTMRAY